MAYKGNGSKFAKGAAYGAGAFATGYGAQTILNAAAGKHLMWTGSLDSLNVFNPLAGIGPAANFTALVGGVVASGYAQTVKEDGDKAILSTVGYAILGALGTLFSQLTIDPPGGPTPFSYLPVAEQAYQAQRYYPYAPNTF